MGATLERNLGVHGCPAGPSQCRCWTGVRSLAQARRSEVSEGSPLLVNTVDCCLVHAFIWSLTESVHAAASKKKKILVVRPDCREPGASTVPFFPTEE